jgi:pyrimidine-nucleoside phosphorylase
MRPAAIIRKKRDNQALTKSEIGSFVRGHVAGKVADYQVSALLMAVYLNGMTGRETAALTDAFLNSGTVIEPSSFNGYAADKHSTGGVGDSVSLILAPLAASLGLRIPMISGRGLGHTGGTLDKLESIPGFRVGLSVEQFLKTVNRIGLCLIGQTEDLCPADKRWYALRDVTSTVESIPLIVASIMSKKLAEGIRGLVLDVKVGSGAFMATMEDAETLAAALVGTGRRMGRDVTAVITDMNQPLARAVGNALETKECIEILRGERKGRLRDLSVELTARMLVQGQKYKTLSAAKNGCERNLANGKALAKFAAMIEAQSGDPRVTEDTELLPKARIVKPFKAKRSGVLTAIDGRALGGTLIGLGGGRVKTSDVIDPAVGLVMQARLGDRVRTGTALAMIHANDSTKLREAKTALANAFVIDQGPAPSVDLIKKVID